MFPKYNSRKDNRIKISHFKGLNRSRSNVFSPISYYSDSYQIDFSDMQNMSDDYSPMLCTRQKRAISTRTNAYNKNAICSNLITIDDSLVWLEDDGNIYINNSPFSSYFRSKGNFDSSVFRNLILMGNYIVILPDKIRINISTKEVEEIENSFYSSKGSGEISTSNDLYSVPSIQKFVINTTIDQQQIEYMNGVTADPTDITNQEITSDYKNYFSGIKVGSLVEYFYYEDEKPKKASDCTSGLFLCTDITKKTGYFDGEIKTFTECLANYTRIYRPGIGVGFSVGDTVKISEINNSCGKNYRGLIGDYVDTLNSVFTIYDVGDDFIVINAVIEKSIPYSGPIKVERTMPDMDFIIERNNRLWGCSSANHEIYCCAAGDCKNWNTYQDAIASDSWACTVGTQGDFTGVSKHGEYIYFFKEDCIHRVSGDYPSNFTLSTIYQSGVEKGSENSVVAIGSSLYFKSPEGICKFTEGYQNDLISNTAFDSQLFVNAVAGRHKSKLYISLQNVSSGEYELYVFNTETGIICKEDNTKYKSTVTLRDNLYYIDGDTGYISSVSANNNVFENFKTFVHPERLENQRTFNSGVQRLFGDVDFDGEITQNDVDLLQKYLNHEIKFDSATIISAQVTGNSTVTVKDSTALDKYIHTMVPVTEQELAWSFITTKIFESNLSNEKIKKIQIRAEITGNAEFSVKTNESKVFKKIKSFKGCKNQSVCIPFFPARCDYFQIKMSGQGSLVLKYIEIYYLGGSSR